MHLKLVGVGCASLAVGAVVVCLLMAVCHITQKYCSKKDGIEVKNNVAYETVNFPKRVIIKP